MYGLSSIVVQVGRTDIVRLNYIYMASLYVAIQIMRLNERNTTQVTVKGRVLPMLLNGVRVLVNMLCVESRK